MLFFSVPFVSLLSHDDDPQKQWKIPMPNEKFSRRNRVEIDISRGAIAYQLEAGLEIV